jgi:hypothetical protein
MTAKPDNRLDDIDDWSPKISHLDLANISEFVSALSLRRCAGRGPSFIQIQFCGEIKPANHILLSSLAKEIIAPWRKPGKCNIVLLGTMFILGY